MESPTFSLESTFPISGVSGYFSLLSCFIEISELTANSVDSDRTPRSAASDLGLHCLPMSLLWEALFLTLLTDFKLASHNLGSLKVRGNFSGSINFYYFLG